MRLKFRLSEAELCRTLFSTAWLPLSYCLTHQFLLKVSLFDTLLRLGYHVQGKVLEGECGRNLLSCRHSVSLSLAQLAATIFRKESLETWPQLMQLLQQSTHSLYRPEREVLLHCWQEGGTERVDKPCKLFLPNPHFWTDGVFAAECGGDFPA